MRKVEVTKTVMGQCDECGIREEVSDSWVRFDLQDQIAFRRLQKHTGESLDFSEATYDFCNRNCAKKFLYRHIDKFLSELNPPANRRRNTIVL